MSVRTALRNIARNPKAIFKNNSRTENFSFFCGFKLKVFKNWLLVRDMMALYEFYLFVIVRIPRENIIINTNNPLTDIIHIFI